MSKAKLPPGARRTSSGRITITMRDNDGNRRSHSKILTTEPATYATPAEAWEGYFRVKAYLAEKQSETTTLRAFWIKWTDVDHHWNVERGRGESTVQTYEQRTRGFVEFKGYGEMQLDQFTGRHLDAFMENGGKLSQVGTISRIFMDAIGRGYLKTNPFATAAQNASNAITKQSRARREENPPPKTPQIKCVLARLQMPMFPPSLYGWFRCATSNGMRGGEVDGMEFEFLDGDVYHIVYQWHAKLNKRTNCKHGSRRKLRLLPPVMREIEKLRGNGSRYIWADSNREHWTHNTRDYWWGWDRDGQPSPRQLAGGATIYSATRHYWASKALNELDLTPYQASLLYGHKDGGKLINEVYGHGDPEAAMRAAYEAQTRDEVIDLSQYREDDDDDDAGATVAA
jgi:hypothetical protein